MSRDVPPRVTCPLAASALLELRERIEKLVERRLHVEWTEFLSQLRLLSDDASDDIRELCGNAPRCRRVLARLEIEALRAGPNAEVPDITCAERMGEALVRGRLRVLLGPDPEVGALEGPMGVEELRALRRLRQLRSESRLLFEEVWRSLWFGVLRGVLLEAGALVVRLEAECTRVQRADVSRRLSAALDGLAAREDSNELLQVAERVATEHLIRRLDTERDSVTTIDRPSGVSMGFWN